MHLLREMLFPADRRESPSANPGESQPVAGLDPFAGFPLHIAHSNVQMKPGEQTPVEIRLHRVSGTSVWGTIKIHRWLADVIGEKITHLPCRRLL